MCNLCSCYIYDIVVSPLPLNHYLRKHIQMDIIVHNAPHIVDCLQRVIKILWEKDKEDTCKLHFNSFKERVYSYGEYNQSVLDNYMWAKLNSSFKEIITEIESCILICLTPNVYHEKNNTLYMNQFFMNKLRILIHYLKEIHLEHMAKKKIVIPPSVRSVTAYELMQIRQKAGLSYTPCKIEEPPGIITNPYDLYN